MGTYVCFNGSLDSQNPVPFRCKSYLTLMHRRLRSLTFILKKSRQLFNSYVIIAPILCEAPDYVKRMN